MKTLPTIRKTAYIPFCLTGILFLFCFLTGHDLAVQGNIIWSVSYTLRTLCGCLFGGCLLGIIFCFLFALYDLRKEQSAAVSAFSIPNRKFFLCSMVLIILAWLPTYLAYYPAICAYDTPIQIGQFMEGHYNDHHPLFHTLLLQGFMNLGKNVFGNVNTGIGLLALMQLLFLAFSFSYGILFLYKRCLKKAPLIFMQLLCMFYPFHWYMSVSITKDSVFTAFFLLSILILYELLELPESARNRWPKELCFFLSAIGCILFRNNGKYAFLVLIAALFFLVLFHRKKRLFWGRILLWSLGAFLTGSILLSAIFRISGAEQGDRREMLSLPIQQLARTMVYHGGIGVLPEDDASMEEADKALINDFILDEGYRNYRPDISDPVKRHTNTYVVRYRIKDFISTYVNSFITYPGDYINAALAVNAGYLYPEDTSHAYVNVEEGRTGRGYTQTCWDDAMESYGVYKASLWPGLFQRLEKWADENAYLNLPILKYLFVPGVWLWFYLLLTAWLMMKKQYRMCLPLTFLYGYYVTLFLGPTVQLRYIYPIMITFPFILALCCIKPVESF